MTEAGFQISSALKEKKPTQTASGLKHKKIILDIIFYILYITILYFLCFLHLRISMWNDTCFLFKQLVESYFHQKVVIEP